ncbi:hypothetical protein [Mesorhizobium sp.]|uniref:hypothetical protein n=1 Tax=Mesorhizobium sp. TaxID=1871066 RepID=UPI000FE58269|nr:hypothetical protein [Mesorhizobium sp.]RWA94556.1 MAG: hypothetical protein EOQ32_12105 [Mesorhizobium sp.]
MIGTDWNSLLREAHFLKAKWITDNVMRGGVASANSLVISSATEMMSVGGELVLCVFWGPGSANDPVAQPTSNFLPD